jgi:XTP/dITP diphosphohydrolase
MAGPVLFYLASGNAHKALELQALAEESGLAVEIRSARELGGMPPVEEDTGTFLGNARKKALALRALAPPGTWVLADDSGLCVDALGGEPGVESAYYAGPQGDAAANLAKLVATLRAVPDDQRRAHFICVLAAVSPVGDERSFVGRCDGRLLAAPRGSVGFGYDPLFVPEGERQSLGELGEAVKNRMSHRARAWGQLAAWWKAQNLGQRGAPGFESPVQP